MNRARARRDGSRTTSGAGDAGDAGDDAARRDALEHPHARAPVWAQPNGGQSDLARVQLAPASGQDVQAVQGSAVHRQGPRHRRALPQSAGQGAGPVRRRESPDSSLGSPAAAVADAARAGGAPDPRLHAPWHDLALRRAERQDGQGHRGVSPPAPRGGIPPVPRHDRGGRAAVARRACDSRQLRHPQDAAHPPLAGAPSALPRALPPTGASWINLVERWFATLTDKQLRRGVHRSTRELGTAIGRYIEVTNERPRPFVWTKTPMKSSRASPDFVIESLTQDTTGLRLPTVVIPAQPDSQFMEDVR